MSKIIGPPQSGRVGDVVYVNSKRYGQLVRKYTVPRNPRSEAQQRVRQLLGALASQWRELPLEAQTAWSIAAEICRTNWSGYHCYMSLNMARAAIGLPCLEQPPTGGKPGFPINPVGEAVVEGSGKDLRVKLPVSGEPAELTLVEVAPLVSRGVRNAQGYRYTGLLPTPVNGASDITAQVVARFGTLIPGLALFIRTRQQINGWLDTGKITRVVIPRG